MSICTDRSLNHAYTSRCTQLSIYTMTNDTSQKKCCHLPHHIVHICQPLGNLPLSYRAMFPYQLWHCCSARQLPLTLLGSLIVPGYSSTLEGSAPFAKNLLLYSSAAIARPMAFICRLNLFPQKSCNGSLPSCPWDYPCS